MPSGPEGVFGVGVTEAVPAWDVDAVGEAEECVVDCSDETGAGLAHPANKTAPSEAAEIIAEYFIIPSGDA